MANIREYFGELYNSLQKLNESINSARDGIYQAKLSLLGEMRWLLEVLMIIPVHNLIWDAAQGNVPSMVVYEKLYELRYTQGYHSTCRSTPWNGITLKCAIIVILHILQVTFYILIY